MVRVAGQDLSSGPTASRNAVCQDLHTDCCELLPPSLSLADSPNSPQEVLKWASQEASGMLGKLHVLLHSFPAGEALGPAGGQGLGSGRSE